LDEIHDRFTVQTEVERIIGDGIVASGGAWRSVQEKPVCVVKYRSVVDRVSVGPEQQNIGFGEIL
jgi:hypothetical protein